MSALPHYTPSDLPPLPGDGYADGGTPYSDAELERSDYRAERRALAVLAEHRENRRGHVGAMRHAFHVLAHEADALGRELSAGADAALQHPFVTGEGR